MKIVVAFSSPKRSAKTVEAAAMQAKALNAEMVLLRIIPDPEKLGVVAQLISTERPVETANSQLTAIVDRLKEDGINASFVVKVGEVAKGIMQTSIELNADLIFVGTTNIEKRPLFLMKKDPIVHYLVDHCPISLCLVRRDFSVDESKSGSESN
jgi:nucleotide-binding universal stress UspA family protein